MAGDESILGRIEASGGKVPRVLLRDADGTVRDATDVLKRTGRYEIIGEIAAGGVGTVMRARDTDLGRDVAIKVLHKKHLDNPDLVRRLIEEAQIGGQLQHPAIVPVYEIGMDEEKVPFLAMKLVKGETLTKLLNDRKDPRSNLRQFLSHFHHACQAMAYAHARGVIHRDLKPSNLMVGSYGEVMILDWGFAKVLARGGVADEAQATMYRDDVTRIETVRTADSDADSIEGSIMGTPAYMPPEQALGHIDNLDKRSDVFSLGAILCEILTGVPPYGTDPNEVVFLASQGITEPAYKRLDKCGAEQGLIDVCKACLAPLRRDRHKDARVLAEALGAFLADIEARTRRMEVTVLKQRKRAAQANADAAALQAQAEAAKTEAAEERAAAKKEQDEERRARAAAAQSVKSRKQALLIAAALVVVVLLGGGAFVMNRKAEATRKREVAAALARGLDKAQTFRSRGRLDEALVAAKQARKAGQQGGVDAETLASVEELVTSMEAIVKQRADAAAKKKKEQQLIAALVPPSLRRGALFQPAKTDAMYDAAFQSHGIRFDQGEQGITATIRGMLDPKPAIAALEDWAWVRGVRLKQSKESWSAPLRLAELSEDDPWRKSLRMAIRMRRVDEIRDLAKTNPAALPVESVRLVGIGLALVGQPEEARAYLAKAQLVHANDAALLGYLCFHTKRWEAATRYASAIVTLTPDVPQLRLQLAHAEGKAGSVQSALRECRFAMDLDPEMADAYVLYADLLEKSGAHKAALQAWKDAVKRAPKEATARSRLGMALLRSGNPKGALAACRAAAALRPNDLEIRRTVAKAALATGDLSEARAACVSVIRAEPDHPDAHRTMALVYLKAKRLDKAREEIDAAARAAPNHGLVLNTRGIILRQQDDLSGAYSAFSRAATSNGPPKAAALANLAELWLAREDLKATVDTAREAVAAAPKTSAGPWYEGFTTSGKTPLAQCVQVLNEVVRQNQNYAYAHHRLGVALEKQGNYLAAIRACETALTLEPEYGYCMQTLAWIYTTCPVSNYRNPKKGLALAERLATVPGHPAAEVSQILGIARYRARDFNGAAQSLQQSLQSRGGGDAWDWYFLAMARWKLGNEKTAKRWLAKANAWTNEKAPKDVKLKQFREEASSVFSRRSGN